MANWRLCDLSNWHQINEPGVTKPVKKNALLHCFTLLCWLCLNGMLSICILFEIRDFVKHQIEQLTRHSSACMGIVTKQQHYDVHSDEMRQTKDFSEQMMMKKVCQKAKENIKIKNVENHGKKRGPHSLSQWNECRWMAAPMFVASSQLVNWICKNWTENKAISLRLQSAHSFRIRFDNFIVRANKLLEHVHWTV